VASSLCIRLIIYYTLNTDIFTLAMVMVGLLGVVVLSI
jgi:hypothetical protein